MSAMSLSSAAPSYFSPVEAACQVLYRRADRVSVEHVRRADFFQPHSPLGPVPAATLGLVRAESPEERSAATAKPTLSLLQRLRALAREHAAGYLRSGPHSDTEYLKDKLSRTHTLDF